ncbi:hypothetical protein HHK36_004932 [Tetracentron sinense]|uniref:DNA topoisomerase n=1 Tax=Tetracentron sinense TaxID=13715 RepID=A0A834ZPH6_TETSI|nr:hypothetical protein HHK36_004932 [Tetracentron sinense]
MSDVVVEDDDFLSLVEAAEADALTRKRRKVDGAGAGAGAGAEKRDEGAYTAALRGSRSLLWQQTTSDSLHSRSKGTVNNLFSPGDAGDSCFKCGKTGHWARDCGALGLGAGDASVTEKPCPCGLGACLVLTANTEKNRGRKFYKCPIREENGGCGFFEWCDNSSGTTISSGNQNYTSNSSFPDLPCPCGVGSCLVLTAKTGKNIGQQFYRCPANQESSCGFFKWCNNHNLAAALPVNSSQVYSNLNDASNKNYGRSGLSCFKCGQEGHWARDCPTASSGSSIDVGGRSASPGTCYKCSKPGHWARDCPGQDLKAQRRQ